MRRFIGFFLIAASAVLIYIWSQKDFDDRYLAIAIASLGILATIFIDIPSLVERRDRKK